MFTMVPTLKESAPVFGMISYVVLRFVSVLFTMTPTLLESALDRFLLEPVLLVLLH